MIELSEIIDFLKPLKVIGGKDKQVKNLISILDEKPSAENLFWLSDKNKNLLEEINSGVIICSQFDEKFIQPACTYLITETPRLAFQKVLEKFFVKQYSSVIYASAKIHSSVRMGNNIAIGENSVVEENCVIGNDCIIGHNTVIHSGTILGDFIKIGSNSVIGGVGFGYEKDETGEYRLINHIGNVILRDYVEIGNCTCIDRAVLGSTILEENVKVDNLVHIAHGVKIGANSLIIANAMIGGSTIINKNVWVAPSSSLINKITIADDTVIGMGAVVLKSVNKTGSVVIGNPAKPLEKR